MSDIDAEDRVWMRQALRNARDGAATAGCGPIGCVIVCNGVVIGEGFNEVGWRSDSTAHSEIVAIRRAGTFMHCAELRGATLYSTLQPCGMCSMAAIWAKIGRIVYGAGRGDVHDMYFEARHLNTIDFIRDSYREDLSLCGGILVEDCAALYVRHDADVARDQQPNR